MLKLATSTRRNHPTNARRRFLFSAAVSAGAVFGSAFAQQAQRIHRVGFLFAGTLAQRPQAQGFWEGLQELGYVPGKNILIEVREAEGRVERLPQLAEDLVKAKPDVIVAVTPTALAAAQKATRTIPIVMAIVGGAVQLGFIKNPARPEGNITGPSSSFVILNDKRLQLFKEMLPDLQRLGVLWNTTANPIGLQALEAAASVIGVEIQLFAFQGPSELERALAAAVRERCRALFVYQDP